MAGSIEGLTEALNALNETMVKNNELLSGAVAAATGKSPAATGTGKAATGTKGAKADSKPAPITHESLKTELGGWIGEKPAGTPENKERKDTIKKLFNHFGQQKLPDIDADKLLDVKAMFEQIKNGEDPFVDAEDDGIL